MLEISPAVRVAEVPGIYGKNDYILFPDRENKDIYYAMAERPNFQADSDGNPNFNLTWYFGSGAEAGGICTLTVALPLPDLNDAEVKSKFVAALTTDSLIKKNAQLTLELCLAMDAGDTGKVAALKAKLGIRDEEAKNRKAVWVRGQGWEQFLPASERLDIRPMPFKSGTVTVQAFADADAYQKGSPEYSTGKLQTTPSLVNSNAAVVTFNLQEKGVNLFWHGLGGWAFDASSPRPAGYDEAKGSKSIIAVTYKVEFDGLLPAASATVTLSHEVMAKLNIEEQVKQGAWGTTYKEQKVTGKEYQKTINDATDIVLPAVASKEDKDNILKLLTDWAAKQMEEMVAVQLPAVKLEDLDINSVKQLSTVSRQSRTYNLTQALSVPKYPQAQLPKIDGIIRQGSSLKKFFQLINLNDKPYFNVDLTVRPPSIDYLKSRQVERFVVTQLSYCKEKLRNAEGKEVSTLEYLTDDKQQPPGRTLSGTFDKSITDKTLKYSYLVAYGDGTPSFHVDSIRQDGDENYLDLGGVDIGVLNVSLDGIDLPWDVISSARIDLRYGDWQTAVTVKRNDPPVRVVKPFGAAMDRQLSYQVTLNLTAGAPHVGEKTRVSLVRGNADITLRNPLGNSICNINFSLDSGVSKAQLRAEYSLNNGSASRVFNQLIQLDSTKADGATASWKVPAFSAYPSTFRVTKARVTVDGSSTDLKDLSGGDVAPVMQDTEITVLNDGLSSF